MITITYREARRVKAGFATIALRQLDVLDAIDKAAAAGFHAVEIWGRPPHTPAPYDKNHTLAIRERLETNGMAAAVFGSYVNSAAPEFEHEAAVALEIACTLGASIIRVWAGDKEPPFASDDEWTDNAARLKWMCERAADEGVTLAMEMHGGTLALTPEGVLHLIELADSDNLKLNYQVNDPTNHDLERSVALVGPHVVMVHAQNFTHSPSGSPQPLERSLIQDGLVDYAHLLSLLKPHGFDGLIEVEFLKGEPDLQAMLDALQKDALYLDKITAET